MADLKEIREALEAIYGSIRIAAPENLSLWREHDLTDPRFVQEVRFKERRFHTIAAQYQLLLATATWGPYGKTWGLRNLQYEFVREGDKVVGVVLKAEFYYPEGSFEIIVDHPYTPTRDTFKCLQTDALTKSLSRLGFNTDIFLGLYEKAEAFLDNKYVRSAESMPATGNGTANSSQPAETQNGNGRVQEIRREAEEALFGENPKPASRPKRSLPNGDPATDRQVGRILGLAFRAEMSFEDLMSYIAAKLSVGEGDDPVDSIEFAEAVADQPPNRRRDFTFNWLLTRLSKSQASEIISIMQKELA